MENRRDKRYTVYRIQGEGNAETSLYVRLAHLSPAFSRRIPATYSDRRK